MKKILWILAKTLGVLMLLVTGGVITQHSFGAFNSTGGTTYNLQSSVSSTQTTVTLTSFTEPVSNIPYTMSYLNTDIVYATINPETTRSEFISFTGITQNTNGSATLTGVVRGLERSYPFVASTTMALAFPGQTRLILSSPPQFFNEYAARRNSQVISGQWQFTTLPTSTVVCSNSSQFCNKGYIDGISIQGAPTSTETNMGVVELATNTELAAGTASSSVGGPLVAPSKYFHSSQASCNAIACVPVAVSGKIAQLFLDLTAAFSVSGAWAFTSTVNIAATVSNKLTLNSLAYDFPGTRAASSTVLSEDGAGNLSWEPSHAQWSAFSAAGAGTITNSYATTTLLTIPAGMLTASSTIEVSGAAACSFGSGSQGTCTYYLRDGTGATFASFNLQTRSSTGSGSDPAGTFSFRVLPNNSGAAQRTMYYCAITGLEASATGIIGCNTGGSAASTVNLGNATTFTLVLQSSASNINANDSNLTIIVKQ